MVAGVKVKHVLFTPVIVFSIVLLFQQLQTQPDV